MSAEAVANWMIDRGYATGHGDTIEDLLKELEWQIRESERERILEICKEGWWDGAGLREHIERGNHDQPI